MDITQKEMNKFIITKNGKKYINFYCCHMDSGLIFVYSYIIFSSTSSILNRILFHNYKFLFNFSLFFLEQSLCAIIFSIFGRNIKTNFRTFWEHKYFYLLFSSVYILNVLSVFYGHQLVLNVSMYFSLKKLTPLMLFFHDFFIGRKKLSFITILSIFLIVGGSLLVTTDSFSKDYLGYAIVLISNILTITYSKLTEIYHKVVGFSNLRLLIYNNYLTLPILFIGVIVTEEYTRLYKYFTVEDNGSEGNFLSLGIYLFLFGLVCSILTSSFFISNEKNSSLITKLLSTSRGIFVSLFLYLFDKKKNNLNLTMFIGLVSAIIGSILINIESLFKNIHTTVEKTGEEKAEGKGEDKEEEKVKVKGDDKDTKNNKEEKEDKKDSKYKINDEEVMIINIKKLNKS